MLILSFKSIPTGRNSRPVSIRLFQFVLYSFHTRRACAFCVVRALFFVVFPGIRAMWAGLVERSYLHPIICRQLLTTSTVRWLWIILCVCVYVCCIYVIYVGSVAHFADSAQIGWSPHQSRWCCYCWCWINIRRFVTDSISEREIFPTYALTDQQQQHHSIINHNMFNHNLVHNLGSEYLRNFQRM